MPQAFRIAAAWRHTLLAAGLLAALAAQAQDVARAQLDLPAARLDKTLTALARQAGVQILFASDLAAGRSAPALKGRFTAPEALSRLLAAHGLEAIERSAGVYVVQAAPAASTPAAHPRPASRPPAPASPAVTTLDELRVIGEKTERRLQDTTSSVVVTTSARIEEENIRDLYDVLRRTANVTQTFGNTGFSIRGIRNTDGGGQAPLSTIYVDGAALPTYTTESAPLSTWDLAQAEILRGPQSTIQGQNALAGAIVLRTEDPTMDWRGKARLQWSDPADRNLAFAGGGPLVADQLAFRLSVERRDFDGFIRNITRDDDQDALESTQARFKLLWTPTALPGLEVRVGYGWYERDGGFEPAYVNTTVPDAYRRRVSLSDFPNTTRNLSRNANLDLSYRLSDHWSLSAVTAWNRSVVHNLYDGDRTAQSLDYNETWPEYENASQELRAHYQGERLQGLVGLYWSQRDRYDSVYRRTNVPTPVATIAALLQGSGFPAPAAAQIADLYFQALSVVPVDYWGWTDTASENKALFSDGEFRLTERLWLLGGLRYDRETYSAENDGSATFVGHWPEPAQYGAPGTPLYLAIAGINQGVAALVTQAGSTAPLNTRRSDALLPKAGLRYALNDAVSLGLVVQRAYRSGGSSYNTSRSRMYEYDPEYAWNYELSLRSQWLDGRLTLNANAYYFDWKDKQTSFNFGLSSWDYHTLNAGRAHMHGFEVELNHRVGAGFDWYASLGHSRSRYDEFLVPDDAAGFEDYSGSEFSYAPRWTAALGGNLRLGEGWLANLNASYRDSMLAQAGANAHRLESRVLVNGKLGYATPGWSAYLFGNNLLDERYVQYNWSPTSGLAVLGDPRVIGVGFEAYW